MYAVSLAQNEYVELKVPQEGDQLAAIATPAGTNATAVFELRIELFTGAFLTVGLFNAITQLPVASITGPNQYAWADIPGAQKARVVRTDATAGDGSVGLDLKRA